MLIRVVEEVVFHHQAEDAGRVGIRVAPVALERLRLDKRRQRRQRGGEQQDGQAGKRGSHGGGDIRYAGWKYASGETRAGLVPAECGRSEEHTSELQSLMRISYAVFCLKKKKNKIKLYIR